MGSNSALLRLIISLEDRASVGLRAIQGGLSAMGGAARGAASMALSLAAPLGAIGAAGIGLGISLNASAEQTEMAFTTLLGSGERAMGFLEELRAFSASTPFEFPELASASRKLLAFGFAAEDIIPMMTAIGDAVGALGGGSAEIERVTMAMGQMQAKGKASNEELMQLAELGLPVYSILSKQLGVTAAQVQKLAEDGLIPASEAIPALLAGMNATFGGAMQGQATTFNGLLSTLKDNASMALMAFSGPAFDRAKVGLQQLGNLAASPQFQQFAADMGVKLGQGIDRVVYALSGIPGAFHEAGDAALGVGAAINGVINRMGGDSNGIGFLVTDLINLAAQGIQPVLKVLHALPVALGQTKDPLVLLAWAFHVMLPSALDPFVTTAYHVADAIRNGIGTALDWLTGTGLPMMRQGLDLVSAGFDAVNQAAGRVQAGWAWLTNTGLPAARTGFEEVAGRITTALQPALDWLTGTGLPAVQGAFSQLTDFLAPLRDALQPVIDGFGEGGLQGALAALPGAIPGILTELGNLRTELTALALEGIGGLLTKAAEMPQLSEGLASLGLSQPIIDGITGTLKALGDAFSTVGGWVRDVGGWFMNDLLPPLQSAGAGFAEMLLPHLQRLGEILNTNVMPILAWFGEFLGNNLPGVINVVAPLLTGLVDMGFSALELVLKAIATTWETVLRPVFEQWGKWFEDLTGGWDNLARGAERVKETMSGIAQAIRDIASGNVDFSQIFGGLQNLFSGNINIPGFANGVTNFSGGLAMVGERGPELVRLPGGSDVIPSGGFGGGGGGGTVINVGGIHVGGSVTAERDLVEAVRSGLIEVGRNNIGAGIP